MAIAVVMAIAIAMVANPTDTTAAAANMAAAKANTVGGESKFGGNSGGYSAKQGYGGSNFGNKAQGGQKPAQQPANSSASKPRAYRANEQQNDSFISGSKKEPVLFERLAVGNKVQHVKFGLGCSQTGDWRRRKRALCRTF